jgi:Bacteriophage head to tail connecting protein
MERGTGEIVVSPESQGLQRGRAQQRYNQLRGYRDSWLDRARRSAKLTLPYLIPPSDEVLPETTEEQPHPWSGIGAQGVNNLAARLLLALLPPTGGFFRLTGDELASAMAEADLVQRGATEADVSALKQEIEKGLATLERAVTREIETCNDRTVLFEALMHLIVGGAVLLYRRPKQMKVFHLNKHVLLRDPMGSPVEAVTCETYLYASLDQKLKDVLDEVDQQAGKWQEENARRDSRQIKVFTHIKWSGDRVTWYQEIGGAVVPGSEGSTSGDASAWIPLRLYRMDGDSYGPGYVEWCAMADLLSNDALNKAVTEGSMQAARQLIGRKGSAITSKDVFARAPNGAVIDAQPEDFFPISTADTRDLGVAYQAMTRLEQRLGRIFLLPDIRDSERTTAEEVKLQIRQIEQMLGSIYSILTVEFQYPYIKRVLSVLTKANKLPELEDIEPVISVGLAALGRQSDAEKLAAFAMQGGQALPQQFGQLVDAPAWLREFCTAMGVNPLLVKSDQRVQEEQAAAAQAQQQQQLIQAGMGDPQKLGNAAMAVQQMYSPQPDTEPQPQ